MQDVKKYNIGIVALKICMSGTAFLTFWTISIFYFYSPDNVEEFRKLRMRVNKFFMSFVSDIVFNGRQDPQDEIIEWLLNCVTFGSAKNTRRFNLFDENDAVDPTPVLRSFLLKLLLQCEQTDSVNKHLDGMLAIWQRDKTYQLQTMVLIMDCRKVGIC